MEAFFLGAFRGLASVLESLENEFGFKYFIVGGALVPFYAEMRQTSDIDVVVHLIFTGEKKNQMLNQLVVHNFYPFTNWDDTFSEWPKPSMITFLDPSGSIKIDMYLAKVDSQPVNRYKKLAVLALKRRVRLDYLGTKFWAQGKEDFIVAKLVYGGYQDYKDALACWIRFQHELDVPYLKETAQSLGVTELLEAIVRKTPVEGVYLD
jgi:predicted nucleotidyltransferase